MMTEMNWKVVFVEINLTVIKVGEVIATNIFVCPVDAHVTPSPMMMWQDTKLHLNTVSPDYKLIHIYESLVVYYTSHSG